MAQAWDQADLSPCIQEVPNVQLTFSQFQTQADQLHLHQFVVQTVANTVSYTFIISFFISIENEAILAVQMK